VNFTALRKMILEDDKPVHFHNPRKIKRKHDSVVVSEQETKEYKVVFKKARLWATFIPSLMVTCNFKFVFIPVLEMPLYTTICSFFLF
jgi:hypothetical protein